MDKTGKRMSEEFAKCWQEYQARHPESNTLKN